MNEPILNESVLFQPPQARYSPATFAVTALILLFLFYQVIGGGVTLLVLGGEITQTNVLLARLATMISQVLFLLLPTLYLAKRQHGRVGEAFSWRLPSLSESFYAIAGMVCLMQLSESYLFFQSKIPVPDSLAQIIEQIKRAIEEAYRILIVARSPGELMFVVLVAAVTPSICEEVMFRGLIQKNFTLAYGSTKGVVLSGVIFALYHLNPIWIVPLIALGIYFSFLRQRSNTLILPVIAHFLNNGASTVGVYLYGESEEMTPTMFMGSDAQPSDVLVLGTGLLFGLIFFLLMNQYIRSTEQVTEQR